MNKKIALKNSGNSYRALNSPFGYWVFKNNYLFITFVYTF